MALEYLGRYYFFSLLLRLHFTSHSKLLNSFYACTSCNITSYNLILFGLHTIVCYGFNVTTQTVFVNKIIGCAVNRAPANASFIFAPGIMNVFYRITRKHDTGTQLSRQFKSAVARIPRTAYFLTRCTLCRKKLSTVCCQVLIFARFTKSCLN